MKAQTILRAACCLLSVFSVLPAAAQLRDQGSVLPQAEAAAPVAGIDTMTLEQREEAAQCLTSGLQLHEYQILVLRRALGLTLAPAVQATHSSPAASFQPALVSVLTELQLARFVKWDTALSPVANR